MYTQDLKKCFQRELEMNNDLCELVKELLKEIFPTDPLVVYNFESDIGYWDQQGCFQGLQSYKKDHESREEYKAKNATKSH